MLQLRDDHKKIVQSILVKNIPTSRVLVFGSRAKGTAKLHSDLDIALINTQPLNFNQLSDLRDDFSFSDLPFFVDVVDYSLVSPAFKAIIDKESIAL